MIAKSIDCTSTATSTLDYLHHDKGGAITAERVAWAENVNCIQASAEETERMWAQLVDDAPEIKRQAGGSTRGRRLENPYAHYVLSWAPDENPSRDEMMTATGDAMDRLGYKGCQRRVVAHSDTDHKHAHVIVCRVHPETGRAMGRKNDGDRLREWSLEYEKAQGQIRVPGRLDDITNRHRYMRKKKEKPDEKPQATDAEKKRRRERRHRRRTRTRDAIGRPINHTERERQEWAALLQSQPTPSEKAALKKAQTERRIKAERSERAVAATPPLMELRPAPMKPPELPRVRLDVSPAPPLMELRPAPMKPPELPRVRLDVSPAPPLMELRPAPTLHRELARVQFDVSPAPPTMEIPPRPSPEDPLIEWGRRQPRLQKLTRSEIEAEVEKRAKEYHRRFGRTPPKERPATARVPTPAEERPAVAQPQSTPLPRPPAIMTEVARRDREKERIAAAKAAAAAEREEEIAAAARAAELKRTFQWAAADTSADTRQAAADLVASQPARLPLDPVDVELYRRHSAPDDHRYTAQLDIGHGATLDVGTLRRDLEADILEHARHHHGRSRVPPAPKDTLADAVIAMVQKIQAAADRLVNRILDQVLGRDRDPAPAAPTLTAPAHGAAPPDEQLGAQGGEAETGQRVVGAPPEHDTGTSAARPPDLLPGGVNIVHEADEALKRPRGGQNPNPDPGGAEPRSKPRRRQDLAPD